MAGAGMLARAKSCVRQTANDLWVGDSGGRILDPAAMLISDGDMRAVRKITIAQAVRQGDTELELWCVAPGKGAPYGGGPNVCGHHSAMHITRAIELFGETTSLSDLRVRCTACGARTFDARTGRPSKSDQRWF